MEDPGLRCNLDMGASGDERLRRVMDDLEMGLGWLLIGTEGRVKWVFAFVGI